MCVRKVYKLKLYLPREKWTMNETLIFFQTVLSAFSTPHPVLMAKVVDRILEINEFELQSCYYVRFSTDILEKGMNPLFPHKAIGEIVFLCKDGFGIT